MGCVIVNWRIFQSIFKIPFKKEEFFRSSTFIALYSLSFRFASWALNVSHYLLKIFQSQLRFGTFADENYKLEVNIVLLRINLSWKWKSSGSIENETINVSKYHKIGSWSHFIKSFKSSDVSKKLLAFYEWEKKY